MKITAEQARALAGPTIEERCDPVFEIIRELSLKKERSFRGGIDYNLDKDLWVNGGYTPTQDWKDMKKIFEKEGFKVSFYYKEYQFVECYTLIEW